MVMRTKNPWLLLVKQDQIEGYTRDVCIVCKNPDDQASARLKVKQTRVECATHVKLRPKGEIPKAQALAYSTKSFTHLETSQFFVSTNAEYCSFSKCALKQAGCERAFSSAYVSITPGAGVLNSWAITMKRNQIAGYSYTVCIQCEVDGAVLASYDNFVISQLPVPKSDLPPVSGKIKEIGVLGDMVIVFDQPMQPVANLSAINESSVQMHLLPNDDWPEKESGFNMKLLDFTWNVTKFSNNAKGKGEMHVKLVFNSPGSISPASSQDKL